MSTAIKITLGILIAIAALAFAYLDDFKKSDFYLRNFNHDAWVIRQQNRAAWNAKYQELERRECEVMLRAKAELIPVEIERGKLLEMKESEATAWANEMYAEEEMLCKMIGKN